MRRGESLEYPKRIVQALFAGQDCCQNESIRQDSEAHPQAFVRCGLVVDGMIVRRACSVL